MIDTKPTHVANSQCQKTRPWLGMVTIPFIKMVMTGGWWFMALLYHALPTFDILSERPWWRVMMGSQMVTSQPSDRIADTKIWSGVGIPNRTYLIYIIIQWHVYIYIFFFWIFDVWKKIYIYIYIYRYSFFFNIVIGFMIMIYNQSHTLEASSWLVHLQVCDSSRLIHGHAQIVARLHPLQQPPGTFV